MNLISEVSNGIIEASTNISKDRKLAFKRALDNETSESAIWALKLMIENFEIAYNRKLPLCDDTGICHIFIEQGSNRDLASNFIDDIKQGIYQGLNKLPARPMAVKGNSIQRIQQSEGLYNDPGQLVPPSFLIDKCDNPDKIKVHILLLGGGPEIRSKTYRVFHQHSSDKVFSTIVDWLKDMVSDLGCTPTIPSIGIGRTHFEASSLMLKGIVKGNLSNQSDIEQYITDELNKTNVGPMGLGGKTTALGSFVNIGPQRASGVRIVSIRPLCFVEPRVFTIEI